MKTILSATLSLIFLANFAVIAQKNKGIFGETNWSQNWTNYKPKSTTYRETEFILNGDITANTTLSRKNCYLLAGTVVVKPNVILTIEPGTIIKGDFSSCGALVVMAGATIIAEGTETDPIIFTSNRAISDRNAGDWGGIIVLGNAPVNQVGGQSAIDLGTIFTYGGSLVADNSGVLKFVRIEFAGKKIKSKFAYNALTIAGVGNGTKIENVQTSFSNNDGFAFLGGNLKVSKLVSFKNRNHDFTFNSGTNTSLSNSLAFRFPNYSDASVSNAIDVRSYNDISLADFSKKPTTVKITNCTIINTDEERLGNTKEAVFVAANTNFTFSKSVIHGFSPAIELDHKIASEKLNNIVIQNVLLNQCKDGIVYDQKDFAANLNGLYAEENFLNEFKMMDLSEFIKVPDFKSNSNFMMKTAANNIVVLE